MAVIYNNDDATLLSGTSGNDSIKNEMDYGGDEWSKGANVTIKALAGNDSIDNYSWNVSISAGAGNDSIENWVGDNVTISGGAGNDKISLHSYADNNLIQYASGDGNDTVYGFSNDDTLNITKGTYTTTKSGNDFIVKVGKGSITLKDVLSDKSNSINIQGQSGKVKVYNNWTVWNGSISGNLKSNVTLAGSKNADTIGNSADNVLITGQAGKDSIDNRGSYVSINGGTGNDTIKTYDGNNVTIDGGKGNDFISNAEDGEGKERDIIINGGAGNDTIKMDGGAGWSDSNYYTENLTITGGTGADVITLNDISGDSFVDGGAGNDTITNNFSYSLKITGGAGNDSIYNSGSKVTISGGSGDDSIYSDEGNNVTISGGTGNDKISLDSYAENTVIQFANGDGNDTVYGFDSDDILQIISDDYTAEVNGNDVIFTVGTGSITLKDAVGQKISIKNKTVSANLFEDNNLSEIVADKNIGEFEYKSEKISQENLITFAK